MASPRLPGFRSSFLHLTLIVAIWVDQPNTKSSLQVSINRATPIYGSHHVCWAVFVAPHHVWHSSKTGLKGKRRPSWAHLLMISEVFPVDPKQTIPMTIRKNHADVLNCGDSRAPNIRSSRKKWCQSWIGADLSLSNHFQVFFWYLCLSVCLSVYLTHKRTKQRTN